MDICVRPHRYCVPGSLLHVVDMALYTFKMPVMIDESNEKKTTLT